MFPNHFPPARHARRLPLLMFSILLISATVSAEPEGEVQRIFFRNNQRAAAAGRHEAATLKRLTPIESARKFLSLNAQALGLGAKHEFQPLDQQDDSHGSHHVRMNQVIGGIPVYGAQVTVHMDRNLGTQAVLGKASRQAADISTTPTLKRAAAVAKAREFWSREIAAEPAFTVKADLYIYNSALAGAAGDGQNHLAWLIQLVSRRPPRNEYYMIDAHSGELLKRFTGQHSIFREVWDCTRTGNCELDVFDPLSGYTYGRSEGQPARGANPYYGGTDTDQMYDLGQTISQYYATKFGRNGANEQGGIGSGSDYLPGTTTVGTYIDTFYPYCPNAFF